MLLIVLELAIAIAGYTFGIYLAWRLTKRIDIISKRQDEFIVRVNRLDELVTNKFMSYLSMLDEKNDRLYKALQKEKQKNKKKT